MSAAERRRGARARGDQRLTEPRASREQAGHTRTEMAAVLGVSARTVKAWESGQNPMPAAMLAYYRHLAGLERIPFRRRP